MQGTPLPEACTHKTLCYGQRLMLQLAQHRHKLTLLPTPAPLPLPLPLPTQHTRPHCCTHLCQCVSQVDHPHHVPLCHTRHPSPSPLPHLRAHLRQHVVPYHFSLDPHLRPLPLTLPPLRMLTVIAMHDHAMQRLVSAPRPPRTTCGTSMS